MSTLVYRSGVSVDDLAVGECTIRRAAIREGARWWQLWALVLRETDRAPMTIGVPLNIGGGYMEKGPSGRHTWGLTQTAPGCWQVSPSIDVWSVEDDARVKGGQPRVGPSWWHQTPLITLVPDDEPWVRGEPP